MGELVTFSIDPGVLKQWKKNNKGLNMSSIIQKHMESMNEEDQKEKKVNARTKSAISNYEESLNKYYLANDTKQVTLDIYKMDKRDLNKELDGITEAKDLIDIRDRAKMVHMIAQTRLKKL